MVDADRLGRIEQRQVETNSLLVEILGVMEIMKDNQQTMAERQVDLEAWLKEPPKSDLPDALIRLAAAVETVQAQIIALPAAVTRAVLDGEISGRG